MSYQASQLVDKLRRVLDVAKNSDRVLPEDALALAESIDVAHFPEFVYRYRGPRGVVQDGYASAATIKRYVDFLSEELHLLDKNLRPVSTVDSLEGNYAADLAKSRLAEVGAGVTAIKDHALAILQDDKATLPTVTQIYRALSPEVALWRFRWLLALYTLGESSLVKLIQRPLVLPRRYGL